MVSSAPTCGGEHVPLQVAGDDVAGRGGGLSGPDSARIAQAQRQEEQSPPGGGGGGRPPRGPDSCGPHIVRQPIATARLRRKEKHE